MGLRGQGFLLLGPLGHKNSNGVMRAFYGTPLPRILLGLQWPSEYTLVTTFLRDAWWDKSRRLQSAQVLIRQGRGDILPLPRKPLTTTDLGGLNV